MTENHWIPTTDWDKHIVQGQGYDVSSTEGKKIWDQLTQSLHGTKYKSANFSMVKESSAKYGAPQVILPRLGQGSFRVLVADSYQMHCAITGSPVLHVLEAAHIKPFAEGGPQSVNNGILLKQDFHTLFDKGYLTINTEHKLEVSRRIKEEFDNGREYYSLHGKPINLPVRRENYPDSTLLEWHNRQKYLG